MIAMQYAITLPADYDMGIIRRRVATRGHLLDQLPGLAFKAYCIQERGSARGEVNQYAPFYVWADEDAMVAFLRGDGFQGVCDSFGRPVVQHWLAAYQAPGPASMTTATWATKHTTRIADTCDARLAVTRAVEEAMASLADQPALCHTTVAFDPRTWEIVRFTLRSDIPRDGARGVHPDDQHEGPQAQLHEREDDLQRGRPVTVQRYQVLHMSVPAQFATPPAHRDWPFIRTGADTDA